MYENLSRVWGHLPKLLGHMRVREWTLIGTLSAEERCAAAFQIVNQRGVLRSTKLLRIQPEESRFSGMIRKRIDANWSSFKQRHAVASTVAEFNLLSPAHEIVSFADAIAASSTGDVILDVSAMPKRFFFPILKRFLRSPHINTLLVTYTVPASYTDEDLSEDPEPAAALPLFAGDPERGRPESLIIALGFQPLGIADMLEPNTQSRVQIIFPLSPDPQSLRLNWAFERSIRQTLPRVAAPIFVTARDMPEVYGHLHELTGGGAEYALLAPYGPKPVSIAMALAAAARNWPVHYTQPRIYHPEYSIGIRRLPGGDPLTFGYAIRIDGRDLYPTR